MKAPDIIYTDGRNTYASAPVFSNIDGNVKYIRADLAEQPSLPSNLDEAANKYGSKETFERLREGEITRKNEGMFRWQIEKAFKAGAEWKQENCKDLSEFECAMLHIGESFFGKNAGLNPNDTALVKEQAKLIIDLIESKPAGWSEEDEIRLEDVITLVEHHHDKEYNWFDYDDLATWLKSLRPQPHWKPSEEQIEALKDAFRKDGGNEYRKVINSLYCDLKKLL